MAAFDELVARIDRAILANLGSVPVTYQPAVGDPVEVTGMFDAQYVLADSSAEASVETLGPAVFLLLEDLPTDPVDDEPTLTIRGRNYRVRSRSPDGFGGILLGLRGIG